MDGMVFQMIPTDKNKYWMMGFKAYTKRYLGKHFFRFHFANKNKQFDLEPSVPIIGIMNHSSWWDVLTSFYITNFHLPFDAYGVIDEAQLKRYRFFTKVGLYSVDRESGLKGVKEFLAYSKKLLTAEPNRIAWICPQGDLISNDQRPVRFFPGVAHLVKHLKRCYVLPLALDYEFCFEPQAEAFALLGKPILFESDAKTDADQINADLEKELTHLMDQLKKMTQTRDFTQFETMISGKQGIHKVYDLFTKLKFVLKGKKFHKTHGEYDHSSTPS